MSSRELFETAAKDATRLRYLAAMIREERSLLSASDYLSCIEGCSKVAPNGLSFQEEIAFGRRLEEERRAILERREMVENMLASLPVEEHAQLLRRRYLYGWTLKRAAAEVGYSLRGAHYAQKAAFEWLDRNAE